MTTTEYLDALRARLALSSDYQLAAALRVTRAAVSRYRTGGAHFDEDIALRVAHLLTIDPARVLADVAAERARTPEARTAWRRIANSLAVVPLFIFIGLQSPALLNALKISAFRLYIMLSTGRKNGGYSRFLLSPECGVYTQRMQWIAAASFACFSLTAAASDWSVNIYGASYHTDRDRVERSQFSELNPGLGARYQLSPHWFLDGGIYRDSMRWTSAHVGVGAQTRGRARVGALALAGYRRNLDLFPAILPFASLDLSDHASAHVLYIPPLRVGSQSLAETFAFFWSVRF